MMVAMSISFSIVGILALLILNWRIYCIHKTAAQRQQIIDWVFAHKNYDELRNYYESVSFNQHRNALMRFKNPFKLYDPDLFSMFHMIKHGPSQLDDPKYRNVKCPYVP